MTARLTCSVCMVSMMPCNRQYSKPLSGQHTCLLKGKSRNSQHIHSQHSLATQTRWAQGTGTAAVLGAWTCYQKQVLMCFLHVQMQRKLADSTHTAWRVMCLPDAGFCSP